MKSYIPQIQTKMIYSKIQIQTSMCALMIKLKNGNNTIPKIISYLRRTKRQENIKNLMSMASKYNMITLAMCTDMTMTKIGLFWELMEI